MEGYVILNNKKKAALKRIKSLYKKIRRPAKYVALNTNERSIEMDQVTQEVNQTSPRIKPILCCLVEIHKLSLQILKKLGIILMQMIKKNGG
jgi:hypothetical protein